MTVLHPAPNAAGLTDHQLLAAVLKAAVEAAPVKEIQWIGATLRITANTADDADLISEHLLGNIHRTGTFRLIDLYPSKGSREVTVTVVTPS